MQRLTSFSLAVVAILLVCSAPRSAEAYSVLAHEALIDSAWEDAIAPMLRERFPAASESQILKARAYAYGGSVIQDLGYYPFGSHFFTNLLHYVRSGDFIEAMVRNASDVYEYAFALGALAHYAADVTGHTVAVNRAVPLIYPKLRAKFGDEVTYADDHSPTCRPNSSSSTSRSASCFVRWMRPSMWLGGAYVVNTWRGTRPVFTRLCGVPGVTTITSPSFTFVFCPSSTA